MKKILGFILSTCILLVGCSSSSGDIQNNDESKNTSSTHILPSSEFSSQSITDIKHTDEYYDYIKQLNIHNTSDEMTLELMKKISKRVYGYSSISHEINEPYNREKIIAYQFQNVDELSLEKMRWYIQSVWTEYSFADVVTQKAQQTQMGERLDYWQLMTILNKELNVNSYPWKEISSECFPNDFPIMIPYDNAKIVAVCLHIPATQGIFNNKILNTIFSDGIVKVQIEICPELAKQSHEIPVQMEYTFNIVSSKDSVVFTSATVIN